MKLIVDHSSRLSKMRAHTATHLLHSQLAKIFPHTKQEGSQVDNDYLRFDFSSDRLLDQFEIASIEKKINQIIYLACDVTTQEMSIDEASKLGAKMFFEDKYGDRVRVVQIKNTQIPPELRNDDIPEYFASFGDFLSTELCGGTHVENTKDIGCFSIIGQEAVASGIKRITAFTGPRVSEKIQEIQSILDITVNKLGIKTATQLQDKLDKTMREYEDMQSKIEYYQEDQLQREKVKINKLFNVIIKVPIHSDFKSAVAISRGLHKGKNVLICNQDGSFAIISSGLNSAKEIAQEIGLKGGGNDDLVQGKDGVVIDIYNKAEFYLPTIELSGVSSSEFHKDNKFASSTKILHIK